MGLALLDPVLTGRKLNPRKIFCNQRMRGRLADENEMGTGRQHRLAQRLTGKQIIAEIDRIEPCIACRMGGEPTLGCGVLAILFFRAVLRYDEFRLERHNLVVTGSDQGRPQHGMEILLAGFAAQSR